MSKLKFDGQSHQLSLVSKNGNVVGVWVAYNNVDSHATLQFIPNGTYFVQDKTRPHPHSADANGPYGLHGIIRFTVPGHPGIEVHAGRAHALHLPGPEHPTMGCIRTNDEAISAIMNSMKADNLETVEVVNNIFASAFATSTKNRHRNMEGMKNG